MLLVVGERAQPRHGHTRGLVRAEHHIRRRTPAVVAFATGHTTMFNGGVNQLPGATKAPY